MFAYLHGSVVSGDARPDSDVDVAAFFAGRVALQGRLLFDDDLPRECAGRP